MLAQWAQQISLKCHFHCTDSQNPARSMGRPQRLVQQADESTKKMSEIGFEKSGMLSRLYALQTLEVNRQCG